MAPGSSDSSTGSGEMTMNDLWVKSKTGVHAAWARTTKRMRFGSAFLIFLTTTVYISLPTIRTVDVPEIHVDYPYYAEPVQSPYNASKVALLVENRALPQLAPLMLHFMSVVPPDWRFRFMGSTESVIYINKSMAIREQVSAGKLDLTYIPSNMSTAGQEMISRFFTTQWLYEVVLQPAEWLLVFQTDSILCANSRQNINDYLDYDWIGAPWNPNGRYGGNGGLSLRRVSAMVEVLRDQLRVDGSEPEDVWLAERLAHRPGARMANGTISLAFSGEMHPGSSENIDQTPDGKKYNSTLDAAEHGEYVSGIDDWREGYYEPMGYHTGGSGSMLHGGIWGTPSLRKHVWDYCPEVKMTLAMDAARYVPGDCHASWKRDLASWENAGAMGERGHVSLNDLGHGTEVIDGVEYPMLPPNFSAWVRTSMTGIYTVRAASILVATGSILVVDDYTAQSLPDCMGGVTNDADFLPRKAGHKTPSKGQAAAKQRSRYKGGKVVYLPGRTCDWIEHNQRNEHQCLDRKVGYSSAGIVCGPYPSGLSHGALPSRERRVTQERYHRSGSRSAPRARRFIFGFLADAVKASAARFRGLGRVASPGATGRVRSDGRKGHLRHISARSPRTFKGIPAVVVVAFAVAIGSFGEKSGLGGLCATTSIPSSGSFERQTKGATMRSCSATAVVSYHRGW
ncbi:hypothetical protein BJ170DRAFT_595648 [Xylariales sp. AK1849]|nr:hypothetical protein BJ170DRAFT_595648 [Xylariales sp. AK1849]